MTGPVRAPAGVGVGGAGAVPPRPPPPTSPPYANGSRPKHWLTCAGPCDGPDLAVQLNVLAARPAAVLVDCYCFDDPPAQWVVTRCCDRVVTGL